MNTLQAQGHMAAKKKPAAKAAKPSKAGKPSPSSQGLLQVLQKRFEDNEGRHADLRWADVQARLEASPAKMRALDAMERTGGEPDVIGQDAKTKQFLFVDCSPQSPSGRRSCCYDRAALESRKVAPPKTSAMDMAGEMGVEILTEDEYRDLQALGPFDTTTSSWVNTPPEVRKLGGALFCDHRYGRVFTFHNGADAYYAARGFRAALRV